MRSEGEKRTADENAKRKKETEGVGLESCNGVNVQCPWQRHTFP